MQPPSPDTVKDHSEQTRRRDRALVRYPDHYAWLILASALDIMVTHTILHYFDGREVNVLANALIYRFGVWGMIALKYVAVVLFMLICEHVGRHDTLKGRMLVTAGIVISAFPVGYGLLQIWAWTH